MTAHAKVAQIMRELLEGPVARPALLRWRRQQFLAKEGFGFYYGLFDSFAAARAGCLRTWNSTTMHWPPSMSRSGPSKYSHMAIR